MCTIHRGADIQMLYAALIDWKSTKVLFAIKIADCEFPGQPNRYTANSSQTQTRNRGGRMDFCLHCLSIAHLVSIGRPTTWFQSNYYQLFGTKRLITRNDSVSFEWILLKFWSNHHLPHQYNKNSMFLGSEVFVVQDLLDPSRVSSNSCINTRQCVVPNQNFWGRKRTEADHMETTILLCNQRAT